MARARFGSLSKAEQSLVTAAPTRALVWVSPIQDPAAAINDPAKAETWGKERTIRAELLEWLVSDPRVSKLVHPSGIGVASARIIGKIDLSFLDVPHPVTLVGCSIPEGIDFSHAQLESLDLSGSWTGKIVGDSSSVRGDLDLSGGRFDSISLFRSKIGSNLDFSGSRLVGDPPLSAVLADVGGDVVFQQGVETSGLIDLRMAKIAQSLSVNHAHFTGNSVNGLNAERIVIGGILYWVDVATTPRTQLDLSDARAGSLWDDEKSWPAPGNLYLDGFVYGDFAGGPSDSVNRLRWLSRQPPEDRMLPKPYRQLAQVLRGEGREEGAVRVDIARQNAITNSGEITPADWLWREALRVTIGYGYRPLLALWWIAGFVLMGTLLFRWGYQARLITPTEENAYQAFVGSGSPPPHYPPFSSFIYSLENFLPVVDLHQDAYWRPNPHHRPVGHRWQTNWGGETFAPRMLRIYLWIHILAGWTITPLLFAGLSGLLRN
jgi:hypothetical protein